MRDADHNALALFAFKMSAMLRIPVNLYLLFTKDNILDYNNYLRIFRKNGKM